MSARTSWLKIRATDEELAGWKAKAARGGREFSEWVRAKLSGEGVSSEAVKQIRKAKAAGISDETLRKAEERGVRESRGTKLDECPHRYPLGKCPFPTCEEYKWRKK